MNPVSNWHASWARFRPEAEALFDAGTGRRWTWAALHRDALVWAERLRREGVRKGDRVAVLAFNRGETIALLFAAAELGAILFPMNWRLSTDELRWQVGHCTPRVLVSDRAHAGTAGALAPLETPLLVFEQPPDLIAEDFQGGPGSALDDPWMLMYTSGSTGRPKGALLTHRQVHWNALDTILACDLTADSSTLTFTPLFHTGGMNSLTTPILHRGGRVVLMPQLDAARALALVEAERITNLMGVPTIFEMLAQDPTFESTDLSCVRDAICGGAPLGLPLLQRYQARGIPLRQGFGLTEVGPNCFSTPPHRVLDKLGTVGMPIHHVAARVVRPDGTECDVGEPGELLLSGPVVFGGYWQDPEATARSASDGWFHTGDVLSVDHEGFFTVRGRLKEMYISGGENVYPAEVEAVVQQCPGVAHAAVVGVPDERWGEVGRAFVEPAPGSLLGANDLRAFLQDRLARFKQPKHITIVSALPRTGSGKIDKPLLARLGLDEFPE